MRGKKCKRQSMLTIIGENVIERHEVHWKKIRCDCSRWHVSCYTQTVMNISDRVIKGSNSPNVLVRFDNSGTDSPRAQQKRKTFARNVQDICYSNRRLLSVRSRPSTGVLSEPWGDSARRISSPLSCFLCLSEKRSPRRCDLFLDFRLWCTARFFPCRITITLLTWPWSISLNTIYSLELSLTFSNIKLHAYRADLCGIFMKSMY